MTDFHQKELDAAKERYRDGFDAIAWPGIFAATSASTPARLSLDELLETVDQFKARDDVRKSGTYFAMLSIRPCPHCGQAVEYVEGPPETIRLCRHVADQLRRMPELKPPSDLPGMLSCFSRIDGFDVEIVESPKIP